MRRSHVILLLAAAFALRLAYGLTSEFFGEDERQVFLIGLQYFSTGAWPYFGPDVVYTHTQLPGALQGLLVGGPLFLVAQPEAPFVVLNLFSTAALALLAWYIGRRLPDVPRWFLWPWVLFSPWTLNYSTHIINTSYILPGAVLFFVGAFELVPALRSGALARWLAFLCVGASLGWTMQIQMQYLLLVPMTAGVFGLVLIERPREALTGAGWVAAGAAVTGATLVPTLWHHGITAVIGTARSNIVFDSNILLSLPVLVARFFSFGSFELARFVGANTAQRLGFLAAYPWAAPFAIIAGAIGVAQTAWLIVSLFRPRRADRHWQAVRTATLGQLLIVAAAFMLSVKGPASHTFYIMVPGVMIYAFYCWAPLLRTPLGRRAAGALLLCGGVTLVALGVRGAGLRSLYTDRPLVMRAIAERSYHLLGERRPEEWKTERERQALADRVRAEFLHAWRSYERLASGHDELNPVSRTAHDWYPPFVFEMTSIDALDTMGLMGLTAEAADVRARLLERLAFDKDVSVQVFEVNIRILGGLITAYQESGDTRFLALAEDLGTRLLPAFKSPTGMPWRFVNLRSGAVKDPISNPAEIGTLILEFGTLSKLTGKAIYFDTAKRALVALTDRRDRTTGLLGSSIDVRTGAWTDTTSHIGGGIDSYYEYVLKCERLFDDPECGAMWRDGIAAVNKHLADDTPDGLWYGSADMTTGRRTATTYGSLQAFLPAVLAMGGDLPRAARLQWSGYRMWTMAAAEPEEIDYRAMRVTDARYQLRPEIIESAYYLSHYTHEGVYIDMGRRFLDDLIACCRTEDGYTTLTNVTTKARGDRQHSFLLAETFKYLYLIFKPDAIDFDRVIFNTEAHPIRKTW